jgi:tRNA A37 threonylcarbamoyladenosine biosynthesis protein TsaE
VTSPTFALVRHYRCGEGSPVRGLIHADVYRTESLAEVADLALAELVEEDAVALVEWGDRAALAFDESTLVVTLDVPDPLGAPNERVLAVTGRGRWTDRAGEVEAVLEPVRGPEAR